MNSLKFSIAEIYDFVGNFKLRSLPATKRAIQYKVERESWPFQEAETQGGKGGVKRIYTLPDYVIEELKEKGVLDVLRQEKADRSGKPEAKPIYNERADSRENARLPAVPLSMRQMIEEYPEWSARQSTAGIVPVRYHTSVFASAGPGSIVWDVETEAMWFRASFFQYLGIPPERCFCTRIKGDSMFPTIIDRGTVLWQATAEFTNEGIYLFRQDNELKVKRLQKIAPGVFRVISDNPNKVLYPAFDLDLTEADEHYFEIYGRCLWACGIPN